MKGPYTRLTFGPRFWRHFARLADEVRDRVETFLNPDVKPHGEELDLLLEDELIAERDRSSPARKRASSLAGAKRLLAQGYPRQTVSVVYGNAITREAEGLLAPMEWNAARGTMVELSGKLPLEEISEADLVH
jgi:hypothetical protein